MRNLGVLAIFVVALILYGCKGKTEQPGRKKGGSSKESTTKISKKVVGNEQSKVKDVPTTPQRVLPKRQAVGEEKRQQTQSEDKVKEKKLETRTNLVSARLEEEEQASPSNGGAAVEKETEMGAKPGRTEQLAASAHRISPEAIEEGIDYGRLEPLFVDLWCAQRKGVSHERLLEIYFKYGYPPIDRWLDVWTNALSDSAWAKRLVDKARSACPQDMPKGAQTNSPAK